MVWTSAHDRATLNTPSDQICLGASGAVGGPGQQQAGVTGGERREDDPGHPYGGRRLHLHLWDSLIAESWDDPLPTVVPKWRTGVYDCGTFDREGLRGMAYRLPPTSLEVRRVSRSSLSVAGSRTPLLPGTFPLCPGALVDLTLTVQEMGGRRAIPLRIRT